MASLAEIQRLLKQQRAGGKVVTPGTERAAFEAFFDVEADKNLQKGRLALQRKQVSNQEAQFTQNLDLRRQAIEDAEDAAKISGIVDIGKLGFMAADTDIGRKAISKAGDFFSSEDAVAGSDFTDFGGVGSTGTPSASGVVSTGTPAVSGVGSTGAQGISEAALFDFGGVGSTGTPAVSEASLFDFGGVGSTGSSSTSLGSSVASGLASAGLSLGAGFAADKLFGDRTDRAGGLASGAVAGFQFGGPPGAVIGAIIGGYGKEIVRENVRVAKQIGSEVARTGEKIATETGRVADQVGGLFSDTFGTWLCTKTKDVAGFTDEEWKSVANFRESAKEGHSDWLEWYISIGPKLLESINGDKKFYDNLKKHFLMPIINLTDGGFTEAAYLAYKAIVISLVMEYNEPLMAEAPGGE